MDDSDHPRDRCSAAVHLRSAMIRTHCDQCDHSIGRVDGEWFGLDHVRLDEDGEMTEPAVDHEFHFCSRDCTITWLMNRSYDTFTQPPTEATT